MNMPIRLYLRFLTKTIRVHPVAFYLKILNSLESEKFSFWFSITSEINIQKIAKDLTIQPRVDESRGWTFGHPSSSSPLQSDVAIKFKNKLWNEAKVSKRFIEVPIKWFANTEIFLPLGTDSTINTFVYSEYEPTEMFWASQYIKKGDTVVDLGAHDGLYSLLFSELVGEHGKVISVEPNPSQISRLKDTARFNEITNVEIVSEAASDSVGIAELNVSSKQHSGHSTLGGFIYSDGSSNEVIAVSTNTLDNIFVKNKLNKVNFIKIDIEGYEIRALRGMARILSEYNPVILCEVLDEALELAGGSRKELLGLLVGYGYSCKAVNRETGLLCSLESLPNSEYIIALPMPLTRTASALT